jgi:hypothetical protein
MSWKKSFLFALIVVFIIHLPLTIMSLLTLKNAANIITTIFLVLFGIYALFVISIPLWMREFCPRCKNWIRTSNHCCNKCGLHYQIVMHYGDYDSDDVALKVWDKF